MLAREDATSVTEEVGVRCPTPENAEIKKTQNPPKKKKKKDNNNNNNNSVFPAALGWQRGNEENFAMLTHGVQPAGR